ncbi:MAG: hypothetical protein DIU80_008795 [Chloroflexota bacterium]
MSDRRMMRDLIVLLPGIMGSVLEKDGAVIWSMPKILGPAILSNEAAFAPLYLQDDTDPERPVLPDNIRPKSLMYGIHGIHGLALGEGYQQIVAAITSTFDVIQGHPESPEPENFIPFPYDWRRDNRAAAHRLKEVVERKLGLWRKRPGMSKARAILIAHSMGGLVARYYLEVLGGWDSCRALITFGTPHRGSLNALDSLCNGHSLGRADLTDIVRSFNSVYQLLPTYPTVRVGNEYRRPAELDGIPGFSKSRAQAALAFHHEIRDAIARRGASAPAVTPIVGTLQPTAQSARLEGNRVHMSRDLPLSDAERQQLGEKDAEWLATGDGTVPFSSAIPAELSTASYLDTYHSAKHAWLPANAVLLEKLCSMLTRMQTADVLDKFQGGLEAPEQLAQPALSVELDNLQYAGTPIAVRARIINQQADPGHVLLTLASGRKRYKLRLEPDGEGWSGRLEGVPPGTYSATVETYRRGKLAPPPITDVLEVVA